MKTRGSIKGTRQGVQDQVNDKGARAEDLEDPLGLLGGVRFRVTGGRQQGLDKGT